MGYTIIFIGKVIRKDLPNLPKTTRLRIVKAINERLTADPINLGEPLYYSLKGRRRLRVGNYRAVYRVNQSERTVIVTEIGHRDTIYDR
ncbi:type II toxin-antitoxin system RelE family toxin [Wolbachia endosymbiont of Ctenocephalides felis wCfeJ]|uniref:type II toxin-antitoxin system RelE family toxin n=1 Tax=Wolbachia endosymbiont of Ctenocephalides felis wCfeJ TaxID=2732594 RepID=UPI001446A1F6|nr:type II toxin-antitoxin system RelE/ParE family toxin [Wolbachia endosymbiont of Ctenocephalides felis wCfeJ]WCR58268.1 MAG: Toxin RelG [Wolbachia endosymbiont of Ctenocephalides felis wCfeJ]